MPYLYVFFYLWNTKMIIMIMYNLYLLYLNQNLYDHMPL